MRYGPMFGPDITFLGVERCDLDDRATFASADVVIVGAPFDGGTSHRPGTRFGPQAIRGTDYLPHDGSRPHLALRVDALRDLRVVDAGDVEMPPGEIERSLRSIEEAVARVAEAGAIPLVLGGDHSITLAELRALARVHGPLALVQLDSHTDTWEQYFDQRYFHGTTFKRAAEEGVIEPAASVQAGMRGPLYSADDLGDARALGFHVIGSDELRSLGPEGYAAVVHERVGSRPVFLSFDIDFLDPAYAPGTGTPEVAGFSTAEAIACLRALRGITLVGADVVEVAPSYDGPGTPTALAASNVAWEILALRAAMVGA